MRGPDQARSRGSWNCAVQIRGWSVSTTILLPAIALDVLWQPPTSSRVWSAQPDSHAHAVKKASC